MQIEQSVSFRLHTSCSEISTPTKKERETMKITISTVRKIIKLAEAQNNAYGLYTQKYFPDGIISFGEDQHETSPEYLEYKKLSERLDKFILSLDYEQVLDLEALMILGRGDESCFKSCRDYLAKTHPNPEGKYLAVEYITSKHPLPDYLENALRKI